MGKTKPNSTQWFWYTGIQCRIVIGLILILRLLQEINFELLRDARNCESAPHHVFSVTSSQTASMLTWSWMMLSWYS